MEELRTKKLGLLMCGIEVSKDKQILFEVKRGKRIDYLTYEELVYKVNNMLEKD